MRPLLAILLSFSVFCVGSATIIVTQDSYSAGITIGDASDSLSGSNNPDVSASVSGPTLAGRSKTAYVWDSSTIAGYNLIEFLSQGPANIDSGNSRTIRFVLSGDPSQLSVVAAIPADLQYIFGCSLWDAGDNVVWSATRVNPSFDGVLDPGSYRLQIRLSTSHGAFSGVESTNLSPIPIASRRPNARRSSALTRTSGRVGSRRGLARLHGRLCAYAGRPEFPR